ncbi:ABC transporter permease [Lysinibacillus sp. fkY74-1]|uniref:ABC transporter, permease protein, putative n=3 Tax=Lysinibacillus TaxID=400634 RepID=B1HW44_LYSSC|nr:MULTISPECIES: ABC transporter permease [Lysinibacillus]MBE5082740.1 ABC transporter permease [Bacillus thuringiensis]ACA41483.1 ABC transporter, permease protein, putative [Lysinibacillus sphaericus C3-41]AMO32634.1 ABC transporter permease [Lysinibacillus sphaericus]AMR92265.1 ABC transporter permease [Lysinibacillus sphaericus]ANA46314.1 ABC transporter permease [Lysinibacillus sphaericus]
MLLTQIKYDLKMFFRELFYLVFTVVVPPVTYILMGQMFSNATYSGGMNYVQMYTPSFIVLISFSVVFFAFGFDQVMNRAAGIEKRLFITPITDKILLMSSIAKSFIIATAGFFLITLIGLLVYDLQLSIVNFLVSYLSLLLINAVMLVYSHAIYSNFKEVKTALILSIVLFQIVMFTGGFSVPVESLPNFVKYVSYVNPFYHLNNIYISIWNETFEFNQDMLISIGYTSALLIISLVVIKFNNKKE